MWFFFVRTVAGSILFICKYSLPLAVVIIFITDYFHQSLIFSPSFVISDVASSPFSYSFWTISPGNVTLRTVADIFHELKRC